MTILAIIKGRGREAIDACAKHGIEAKFIREDVFGSSHVEIDDRFASQIAQWFAEDSQLGRSGYVPGTLLFSINSQTEA